MTLDKTRAKIAEASVTIKFDEPVGTHSHVKFCNEKDYVGLTVAHSMTYPDYFMVAGDLGCNVSQKGSGHARGTRLLCEKGQVPKN